MGIDQGQGQVWKPQFHESLWNDMRAQPGSFIGFGFGSNPTIITWKSVLPLTAFQANDELPFTVQMSHGFKSGTDLNLHCHWTPHSRGVAESGNTVPWKVDMVVANVNGVFGSVQTYDLTDTCSGVDDQHEITAIATVPGSGLILSHIIVGRVYRDGAGTWVGTSAAQSPGLLELDFHFETDLAGGSRQEFAK